MGDWFIGEIRAFGAGTVPNGWLPCDGRQMQIQQNMALYTLIGTYYGGDGKTYFQLPDLRGRVPVAASGTSTVVGTAAGAETVSLTEAQVPPHSHMALALNEAASKPFPAGNMLALPVPNVGQTGTPAMNIYGPAENLTPLASAALSPVGGASHDNTQPSLTVNLCIAVAGVFPQRD